MDIETAQQIIFFGDSLTAGYGLTNPHQDALPALIQQKIRTSGLAYQVINAGVSGDTSRAGLNRIDGLLDRPIDIFVLALGANDMLQGESASNTRSNLQSIINKVKSRHPAAQLVLIGMQLPAWIPGNRAEDFRQMYPALARDNEMAFLPFMLQGVAGIKHLNMYDGVHPLAAGYQIIAENVWQVLKKVLNSSDI
jgi:acyl-CoA thioesterase-1